MSTSVFSRRPTQERDTGTAHVIARGESVLLTVTEGPQRVQIGASRLVKPVLRLLTPGQTLIIAAGAAPVSLHAAAAVLQRVPAHLLRLLAFHDHAQGMQRELCTGAQPRLQTVAADLHQPDVARHWLMEQLQQQAAELEPIAGSWARTESYQLVRFVLETPDSSVQQLATRYGLSVAQFRRLSRKAFDRSLKEQLRLMRAGRVLLRYAETGESFTRLSSDFGFSSPSHFCCEIKALLGKAPSSIFRSVMPS